MILLGIAIFIIIMYLADKNRHKKEIIERLNKENTQLLKLKNNSNLKNGEKIVQEFYKLLSYTSPKLKINSHINEALGKRTFISLLNENKSIYFEILIKDKNAITIEFDPHTSHNDENNYFYFSYDDDTNIVAKKLWTTITNKLIFENIVSDNFRTLY